MADAAVSALVKEMVGRLTSEVVKEFNLLWGFKRDISSLTDDFKLIQAVIEDAQEKRVKEKEVDIWLTSLRSACLEIENVLDEISTEALLQRLYKQRGIKYMVRSFMSSNHNPLMFRVRIAHKVKDMRRKLDAIKSRRSELGLKSNPGYVTHLDVNVASDMPNRETSSLIHSSVIFGREEEVEVITKVICNEDDRKQEINGEVRVYSIWGMGGVGKTTLAQLVYNHERVNQYFELKCWIYVSQNFQVKEIIKGIITSIDKCECTLTSLEMLQECVQSRLRGKKFLIVLDDIWIEEGEKIEGDQLSKTLSCGAEESIVVMTTRSQRTSHMFAKVPQLQHNVGCLSREDSWSLFEKFAFAQGREVEDVNISELEPIGREIVEKCKGLPLAIKTLGSLMWSKKTTRDWESVKGSIIWNLQEYNVLPALKLSYDNLQPHLQKCFAYCCLFPKGHELEKNTVIQLWVVNGFIPPREHIDLYVLGEEIFNCLVWRSFFQVVTNTDRYKMHDLMHDMARYVMRHDCLVIDNARVEIEIPDEVLHLSSSCPNFLFSSLDLRKLRSLRSILMWKEGLNKSCNIIQILNLMYLRVLYLPRLRTLPKSICKLKHLRHLNLSHSVLKVLPESIIYLQNLQVLILRCSYILCKLPDGLRYMKNLQYLDIEHCDSIKYLPVGLNELTSLQIKISKFYVGKESRVKIGELGNLNLLGKLKISGLEHIRGSSDAKSANLIRKRNLSDLELCWSAISPYAEEVLEGLEPNPNLKKLTISKYTGNIISSTWMANLRNLVEITFQHCSKCELISSLGRLPNLRVIKLEGMSSLKCFPNDDTNNMFPSLEELHIDSCEGLVSLSCNLRKLKVLHINGCKELVSLVENMFPSLEELHIDSCENLVSLPCKLPKLKFLDINRCKELLSMVDNLFPSLEELLIYSCGNLVSLACNLPKLKLLKIQDCGELVSLQENMFTLEELHIGSCGSLIRLQCNLPKLKVLDINCCTILVSMVENMFPSIEELHIDRCWNLFSLPCNLPKLKLLNIRDCQKLVFLQENMVPSLEELRIPSCQNLVSLLCNFPKLKILEIRDFEKLESLNDDMFYSLEELRIGLCGDLVSLPCNLPKLKVLNIWRCGKLVSLRMNMFPSLEELRIQSCENLVSLPCSLSKLKLLNIRDCQKLVSLRENFYPSLEELHIDSCGNSIS